MTADADVIEAALAHLLRLVKVAAVEDQRPAHQVFHFVEIGPADKIYDPPYHPYTEALLSAVPIADPEAEQKGIRLSGNVPSALDPPSGCYFHTRCPRRKEMLPDDGKICKTDKPPWQYNGTGHRILCHIPIEELIKIDPVVHQATRTNGS